jgi:hypothetical protein
MTCAHCGSTEIEKRRHLTPLGKGLFAAGVLAIAACVVTQFTEIAVHSVESAFGAEFARTVLFGALFCVVGMTMDRKRCRCRSCNDLVIT